ncbi:MAG TPA: redoxin domain-containing protein [Anaeromyxobacteraceae bacterium]|nr:redoxin domain-containing protein [Anaeromyxobacteraceae bacterium]
MALGAGDRAPTSMVRDLDGGALALPVLAAAGPAVLFIWKADCPTCHTAAHALPRLAAVAGLRVAAISQDGPAETRAFAAAHGWDRAPVDLLLDPEPWPASDALGVRATPTWILLAPGGRVEAAAEGWSREEANALAARAAALAGAPATVVSRPEDGPALRPG